MGCAGWLVWCGYGRYVAEQVAQQAAGAVDGGAVVGEAAEDVHADNGGRVPGFQPAGGEGGQLRLHGVGDMAQGGERVG